ncbi:MAG: hypothetical protein Q9160_004152 [Pyrenula sp. 1 TL-2023]
MTGTLSTLVNLQDLLGKGSWRNLNLVILESIAFTESEIISFITHHATSLKHLTMWKCGLKGFKGFWANIIKAMSQLKVLELESLQIKRPWHVVGLPFQGPLITQATPNDVKELKDARKPPEGSLLEYVNSGGHGTNPYEQGSWSYYGRQREEEDACSTYSDATTSAVDEDEEYDND